MASQTVSLVAVSENAAKKIALGSGGKIKVQAGTKYLLQTENSQVAPENITVKRIGKDLLVSFEGSEKPDVTLQGFFADGMDSHLYGVSEDGQLHAYLRTDGEGFYGPLLMADGESAPIALGGDGVAYSAPLVGETDDSSGFTLWPLLLGLAGVGAAAAIIHHNRDDGHKTHTSPAPTDIKVMDDVGPIQGQLSNGDITDDAHPAISGNGVPGAIIHLFDNGQEIGSTTVAPDGTWTLTPELADGEHSFDATQVVPGQKPSASVEVIDLIVDTLAPAKPAIEQVLDTVGSIQGPIANGGVTDDPAPTLSGKAEAGSTVTLYDNGQQMGSVVADANGQWSYTPATPLSEGEHLFSVDATDKAGNTSEPSDVFSIVTDYTAPVATLTIDVVAGDDIVNLFESKAQQLISGKAGGEFLPGDLVTFTLNGTTYSAAVNASGDWKVAVAGADLAEDSSIHATLVAHDAAGNSASVVADHAYSVDLDPPLATLAIDVVAGDDVVNLFESRVPQLISGKVGGEFMPGDLVTFTLNGTAYSAAVTASGDWKVTVAGADLAGETSIRATLVAHDAAGNDASVVADHAYVVDVTPPVATLSIDVVASDDVVNLVESQAQQTISGKAGGEFKAGDLVSFTLNGHAYSAAVKASGDWSVSVAGSDLARATGIHATLVAHDAAGNSASVVADHAYTVDVTPPVATLTIDTVADDDVINLEESKVNQTVSGTAAGEFRAGDIVSFELNDVIYSAAVAADGKWSVAVAGSDLVKDTNIHATLVAHDAAGNVGNIVADHAYTVAINPGTTTLSIDSVTGDDIVNLVESQASQTISGKVVGTYLAGDQVTFTLNGHEYSAAVGADGKAGGEFLAGDLVTFSLNGVSYSATVNASGDWSVQVPGAALVDDIAHSIHATLVAHDAAGNSVSVVADRGYSPDNGDDHPRSLSERSAPISYTVLLDTSGSMGIAGIESAQAALKNLLNTALKYGSEVDFNLIEMKDAVTDYGYFNFSSTSSGDYSRLMGIIDSLAAGGNENYKVGLATAEANILSELGSGLPVLNKQVFFISDGNPVMPMQQPTASDLSAWSSFMEAPPSGHDSITVTTIGIGWGITPSAYLDKISTSGTTLVAPSAAQLDAVLQANMIVDVVSGNVLENDMMVHRDGTEHLTQLQLGSATYTISSTNMLLTTGSSSYTASYNQANGKLELSSTTGRLELYMKSGGGHTAGDYRYELLALGAAGNSESLFIYTGVDGHGHTQTATLYIDVEIKSGLYSSTHLLSASDYELAVGTSSYAHDGYIIVDQVEHLGSDERGAAGSDLISDPQTVALLGSMAPIFGASTQYSIDGLCGGYYNATGDNSYITLHNAEAYLASDANQGIHGSAGVDTLAVAGHDQVLDLTAAHGKVTGMEVIDLTGDGQAHNSLKLSLEDVLDNGQADLFHSGDSHSVQMLVKGDSSDVVNLDHHSSNGTDSTWSDKGTVAVGDISYHVYQNSSTEAELLIQQGVQVHLV